jgi:hypothetical protein
MGKSNSCAFLTVLGDQGLCPEYSQGGRPMSDACFLIVCPDNHKGLKQLKQ